MHATDAFQYTITDEHGATSTATLTITITGTNDAPVAVADIAAVTVTKAGVAEAANRIANTSTATGNVLTNDTDVDNGAALTVGRSAALPNKVGNVGGRDLRLGDRSIGRQLQLHAGRSAGSAADHLAQGEHVYRRLQLHHYRRTRRDLDRRR